MDFAARVNAGDRAGRPPDLSTPAPSFPPPAPLPRRTNPEVTVKRQSFHLHLVSDSTGETLMSIGRAAAAQYQGVASMEHIYPLVRTRDQLDRAIAEIETAPSSWSRVRTSG